MCGTACKQTHRNVCSKSNSMCLRLTGGPGMGKSMRATRLKKLLCKDWVRNGAQQSSAKSGMNGGAPAPNA